MPSLIELIEFVPQNDIEKTIFDSCKKDVLNDYLQDTKSDWSNGMYYLGGFIKMKPNEDITNKKNIDAIFISVFDDLLNNIIHDTKLIKYAFNES